MSSNKTLGRAAPKKRRSASSSQNSDSPGSGGGHSHQHSTHPEIIKRLKRAEGHLRALIGMMENGRPCLDLAQQLHAVESAISNAKTVLIHDHVQHCIEDGSVVGANGHSKALQEFKALMKYL
jgi:uncharacterized protein